MIFSLKFPLVRYFPVVFQYRRGIDFYELHDAQLQVAICETLGREASCCVSVSSSPINVIIKAHPLSNRTIGQNFVELTLALVFNIYIYIYHIYVVSVAICIKNIYSNQNHMTSDYHIVYHLFSQLFISHLLHVQAVDWLWDGLNALVLSISLQVLVASSGPSGDSLQWT